MELAYGDDPWQFGQLWMPGTGASGPLIVLMHGGFWRAGKSLATMEPMAAAFVERGFAVWNVEYGAGLPGRQWTATLDDVCASLRFSQTISENFAVDSHHVIWMGHSAGGHLALLAASRCGPARDEAKGSSACSPPRMVVTLAGICDLAAAARMDLGEGAICQFLGGQPEERPERYRAACPTQLLPLGVPQLLVHGNRDGRVPVEMSRRYLQAARAAGDCIRLVELSDADHNSLIDPRAAAGFAVVSLVHRVAQGVELASGGFEGV